MCVFSNFLIIDQKVLRFSNKNILIPFTAREEASTGRRGTNFDYVRAQGTILKMVCQESFFENLKTFLDL